MAIMLAQLFKKLKLLNFCKLQSDSKYKSRFVENNFLLQKKTI